MYSLVSFLLLYSAKILAAGDIDCENFEDANRIDWSLNILYLPKQRKSKNGLCSVLHGWFLLARDYIEPSCTSSEWKFRREASLTSATEDNRIFRLENLLPFFRSPYSRLRFGCPPERGDSCFSLYLESRTRRSWIANVLHLVCFVFGASLRKQLSHLLRKPVEKSIEKLSPVSLDIFIIKWLKFSSQLSCIYEDNLFRYTIFTVRYTRIFLLQRVCMSILIRWISVIRRK